MAHQVKVVHILAALLLACERSRDGLERARTVAAEARRADLLQLVAVESAFVADSGHPTAVLMPPYTF